MKCNPILIGLVCTLFCVARDRQAKAKHRR